LVKNSTIIEYSNKERFMQTGNPVFDATTFEIWGSLLNGSSLYLASNDVIIDSLKLKDFLHENKISVLWLTSSLFNQHVDQFPDMFQNLKYLLVGGDVLSPKHISKTLKNNPAISIINGYGPTENTTFSTTFNIEKSYCSNIPIGKPITNSTVYILSADKLLQPIGVPGELCVGGDGVAIGYLHNKELTEEKFVSNPFTPNTRMYKTGDLARWLPDGTIEFLGRVDRQIKIRGFRVELGEIENHLSEHEKIKESVVIVREKEREKYLIAYYESEKEIEVLELRNYLSLRLPAHMVPSFYVHLEKFPLTSNGKIDRKLLPEPETELGDYVAPANEIEKKLVKIWAETLGIEQKLISTNQNFFMLGGNSLNAIRAIQKLKVFIPDISTNDIFVHPTIQELAALYSKAQTFENKKYSNMTEIEEKLTEIFDVKARLFKYKLSNNKDLMVLFLNRTITENKKSLLKFIETELDNAFQPHYIIENKYMTTLDNLERVVAIKERAFFRFIHKMRICALL
jgi:hypothetical protein